MEHTVRVYAANSNSNRWIRKSQKPRFDLRFFFCSQGVGWVNVRAKHEETRDGTFLSFLEVRGDGGGGSGGTDDCLVGSGNARAKYEEVRGDTFLSFLEACGGGGTNGCFLVATIAVCC